MKKNKNKAWTSEEVFCENSKFWEFSNDEVEDYYWQSFKLKHKIYFKFLDGILIIFFVIYVLIENLTYIVNY